MQKWKLREAWAPKPAVWQRQHAGPAPFGPKAWALRTVPHPAPSHSWNKAEKGSWVPSPKRQLAEISLDSIYDPKYLVEIELASFLTLFSFLADILANFSEGFYLFLIHI